MAIQIGKYKRPGIFIEEIDKSVFSSPITEGITNLVMGVSKKGPVNTPIRLTSVTELEAVFGQLDRNLERKGSFFHRTVSKMLETTPVYAMNLLLTDDTLDTIEYKSLSTSSLNKNDIKREGPYRRFFDTTGFWKRDTESFINLTKNNQGFSDRALSFTNLSDRNITVFVVKTQVSGFDRTLLEWYGSVEKMPTYVSAVDYASDYMVDVIVVGGDWSNYRDLAVDTRWSSYFNAEGLIKGQLRNFANDRNITLLSYYEGLSLIPYFRDLEGRNIFIETTINRDTDTTGLFCAFNAELVEKDFYTGLVDLVGNTIVNKGETEIDFLSYKEKISEKVELENTPLDLPGNVTSLFGEVFGVTGSLFTSIFGSNPTSSTSGTYSVSLTGGSGTGAVATVVVNGATQGSVTSVNVTTKGSGYIVDDVLTIPSASIGNNVTIKLTESNLETVFTGIPLYSGQLDHAFDSGLEGPKKEGVVFNANNRTGFFGEGSVNGLARTSMTSNTSSITVDYGAFGTDAFAIIDGNYVEFDPVKSFTINSTSYVNKVTPATYYSAFILTAAGVITSVNGTVNNVRPSVAANDIVLGYVKFDVTSGSISSVVMTDVTVNTNGYKNFGYTSDLTVTEVTPGSVKIEFPGTANTANTTNYVQYRRFKMFNELVGIIDSSNKNRVSMLLGPTNNYKKLSLENVTITNIVTSTSLNKSFVLNTGLTTLELTDILKGFLVFYTEDNEFMLGSTTVITTDEVATPTTGVVGKYSKFYSDYFNGAISTGDFFYDNRLYMDDSGVANTLGEDAATVEVIFTNGEIATSNTSVYAGYDYVIFKYNNFESEVALDVLTQLMFPSSSLNKGVFTINDNHATAENAATLAVSLGFTGGDYYAYEVAENVVEETLTDVNVIYDINVKHYLKMYLDNSANLFVAFKDVDLDGDVLVDIIANNVFYVQSEISNLKQTIEIETVAGYTQVPNKILVNGARYTELKVGDFLEADTTDVVLEVGQTAKRNLTRILSKRQYAGDTSLSEITCDGKIAISNFNGDLQTTRYSTIEQYANTYKGISLKGFRMRQASLPDGTETKQNQILNLVAKGTPLFKSLINKEAFDFRYLVDSFGLGLTERSKQQLVDICGERLDVFGFINMPSIRSFKNSSSPSFVNREGVLQTEFIAKGGDPESNPAFLYSFGEGAGTTCTGYFTPYVTVNDNGRPLEFPPASFVATTYMRKHISNVSSVTPWTIAAGVTNGRVTGISGLEIDFDPSDIEFLNQAQMNPIVLKRNRGYIIETENTALTLYKSSLSLIHVREVLVELERELSRMLLDYQWKFNTPDVRAEIKLRADVICETFVSRNGLFNYFNKMDDENNTSEIIDNQIGVLDTYIEPIKGMGIIVNNITILRTGAVAAGGFINQ